MSSKVVRLPFDVVNRIIDLAESPAAREVEGYESPLPRRGVPELREPILTELKKKRRAYAGGLVYLAILPPEDAAALSEWCRAVALQCPADAAMLQAAAYTIDKAT